MQGSGEEEEMRTFAAATQKKTRNHEENLSRRGGAPYRADHDTDRARQAGT